MYNDQQLVYYNSVFFTGTPMVASARPAVKAGRSPKNDGAKTKERKAWGTVRKKMATGTFTYDALRTKTLKERIKTQRKIVSHSNSTRAMLLV